MNAFKRALAGAAVAVLCTTIALYACAAFWALAAFCACTAEQPVITSANRAGAGNQRAAARASPPGRAVLTQVDGGPGYYARFAPSLPASAGFFPVGVWFESVTQPADAALDKAAGINTYVQLTDNSDINLIRQAGMYAIDSNVAQGHGSETVGWLTSDEADMWAGPGNARWTGYYPGTGVICAPASAYCGYTVQRTLLSKLPHDHRLRYSNYGKGVIFWDSDAEAAPFINEFQDVVSADTYWLTDDDICAAGQGGALIGAGQSALPPALCHLPSNYGLTVDRMRDLVSPRGSKPVWALVEVGHPFTQGGWPTAKPADVVAAVWSSLIHGARGIVYFNHSFGGPCVSQSALREPCYTAVRAAVTRADAQIAALAPVLNAPFAAGVVHASAGVAVSVKWYRGHFYLLAGSTRTAAQTVTFSMPCVGRAKVTVLFEGRELTAEHGAFRDRFASQDAVHRYRIDGGNSCGA